MKLNGHTAIITGGASGLGEATLRRFVEQSAKVVILDVNAERGRCLANELGGSVRFAKADVASESEVQAAVDMAVETFGGPRSGNLRGYSAPGTKTVALPGLPSASCPHENDAATSDQRKEAGSTRAGALQCVNTARRRSWARVKWEMSVYNCLVHCIRGRSRLS